MLGHPPPPSCAGSDPRILLTAYVQGQEKDGRINQAMTMEEAGKLELCNL